jgi:hypothetical protein
MLRLAGEAQTLAITLERSADQEGTMAVFREWSHFETFLTRHFGGFCPCLVSLRKLDGLTEAGAPSQVVGVHQVARGRKRKGPAITGVQRSACCGVLPADSLACQRELPAWGPGIGQSYEYSRDDSSGHL